MELSQLKYFKTVAQVGKISAAAQQLFISAPALSTSISRLEKELGMPLFTRTNNRIALNPQGEIFLNYVNQIFDSLENARQDLRESLLTKDSHIGVISCNTTMWTDFIAVFTAENPHIALSWNAMKPSSLAEKGLESQYTFLLAAENEIPEAYKQVLDSIFLLENYPMVMLNQEHPLAKEPVITIDMLQDETLFMPTPEYALYERIAQLLEHSPQPAHLRQSHTFLVRQQMVSMNSGISFASKYTCYSTHSNITFVPLEDPFPRWANRLYWRKDHIFTPEEETFRDFAAAFCRNLH